jgi:hypothetical protein
MIVVFICPHSFWSIWESSTNRMLAAAVRHGISMKISKPFLTAFLLSYEISVPRKVARRLSTVSAFCAKGTTLLSRVLR